MLKHGKLSMSVLTGEADVSSKKSRRKFRDMLANPSWATLLLTATLYALSVFTVNAEITRDNVGWLLGFPLRMSEFIFGRVEDEQLGTVLGALRHTCYHAVNLVFWYVLAAVLRRQRRISPGDDPGV